MTHRTFISIILAASLAITGMTAAPARADSRDAAKVIAGVAALAIIGAVIAEDRKDRRRKAINRNKVHHYNHGHRHNGHRHYSHKNHRYNDHGYNHRGYKKSHKRYSAMPSRCRADGYVRGNPVYGYGRRCLINNYSHYNALPHNCAVNARGYNGGKRVIYSGQCLRNYGYVTPDRR